MLLKRRNSRHLAPTSNDSEFRGREKFFILDCVAVESIARDYNRSLPRLGSVIPPYNAQDDKNAKGYFRTKPVPPLLQQTGQARGGTSVLGPLADRFAKESAAALYLSRRNSSAGADKPENFKAS
uniref:Chromosome LG9 open reading frame, human C17orf98 n=1 Tax=Lepisosteus oculatus TaxID=7918 RepID=W5N1T8_LEPOC